MCLDDDEPMLTPALPTPEAVTGGVTRRSVLRGGVAGSALALSGALGLPGVANAVMPGGSRDTQVAAVIYDQRFSQARHFAERFRNKSVPILGYQRDMTRVWLEMLSARLYATRLPIVGLTDAGALFCFEQQAWDHGMRVRLKIHHVQRAGGVEHHSVTALPSPVLARLHALRDTFGGYAADLAIGNRGAWGDCTHSDLPAAAVSPDPQRVTWVIAPKQFTSA